MFLLPLIMIGQNLQGKHAEFRAEAEYEVIIKTAREIETVLKHLENQNKLSLEMLGNLQSIKKRIEQDRSDLKWPTVFINHLSIHWTWYFVKLNLKRSFLLRP